MIMEPMEAMERYDDFHADAGAQSKSKSPGGWQTGLWQIGNPLIALMIDAGLQPGTDETAGSLV